MASLIHHVSFLARHDKLFPILDYSASVFAFTAEQGLVFYTLFMLMSDAGDISFVISS